ncbi:Transcription factor bHLH51 [Linum perenne]
MTSITVAANLSHLHMSLCFSSIMDKHDATWLKKRKHALKEMEDPFSPWSNCQESAEDKAASSSRSHSQAEKRRRDRINAQLGSLRKLIPKSDKMDKAALLQSVIEQVRDLKNKANEVEKKLTIPSEIDEISVDYCENSNNNNNVFIRASLSCEDRPELLSELIRMVKGQRLEIVQADITSVGGRIKSVFVFCNNGGEGGSEEEKISSAVSGIKQSLNVVLSRIASATVPSSYRIRSKRQRFFMPSN